MYCKNCGNQIEEGSAFCSSCGTPVEESGKSPNQPVVSPEAETQIQAPPPVYADVPKKSSGKTFGIIAGIAAVVIAAVVLCLVFLVFKSDDTGKAKEYMMNVEKLGDELSTGLTDTSETLSKLGTDMESGQVQSSSQFEAQADRSRSAMEDLKPEIAEIRAELKKFDNLKGVEDYKEYASLRTQEIDSVEEMLGSATEMLNYLSGVFKSIESGVAMDENEMTSKVNGYSQEIKQKSSRIEELDNKVKKLEREKNL
ncbi:MAG: zinc-ribbon domain-containing protein [Actinomycetota bacterium]|nr:zinc-ribbon domain-containing protein [Actinomycetota bacterium]